MAVVVVVMYLPVIIFLITGIIMKNHYSQFPDTFAGFHLRYAVKNKGTWDEANKFAGLYCIISSLIILVLDFAITCFFIFFGCCFSEIFWASFLITYIFVSSFTQMILLFVLPYFHLKKKFGV